MHALRFLTRCCTGALVFEGLLAAAHLVVPPYHWGQGRTSYFDIGAPQTLASWLASMQLAGAALLCLHLLGRARRPGRSRGARGSRAAGPAWGWALLAAALATASAAELTRFPARLRLPGFTGDRPLDAVILYPAALAALGLAGWLVLSVSRGRPRGTGPGAAWLGLWGLALYARAFGPELPGAWAGGAAALGGFAYLAGTTFLLAALAGAAWLPAAAAPAPAAPSCAAVPRRAWLLAGVGLTAGVMILFQILLFRMLEIFGDHLTAHSALSVALLGLSAGGLVGSLAANRLAANRLAAGRLAAGLLLPPALVAAFAVTALPGWGGGTLAASVVLSLPFVCAGVVLASALVQARSSVVYFLDLAGAACGAVAASAALAHLREETTAFVLAAAGFLAAACLGLAHTQRRVRRGAVGLAGAGCVAALMAGISNLDLDWLNVVRTRVLRSYPRAEILFSRSSLVGRYDVIRRDPSHSSLSTCENGRIIDTVRARPPRAYRIDPRVPHTLMKRPDVLILGLSGDGVIKTCRALGGKVEGVEINPAVVRLQRGELSARNARSYDGVEVSVMDGRTFIERSRKRYDIITLMNAHASRGGGGGGAAGARRARSTSIPGRRSAPTSII